MNIDPQVVRLYEQASKETGVVVDFDTTIRPALQEGRVLLTHSQGRPVGFLQFVDVILPDTNEHVLVERMLYVKSGYARQALALIKAFENEGVQRGCCAVLAGSSLNSNEAARRLYEHVGFKTNYTFRKDI